MKTDIHIYGDDSGIPDQATFNAIRHIGVHNYSSITASIDGITIFESTPGDKFNPHWIRIKEHNGRVFISFSIGSNQDEGAYNTQWILVEDLAETIEKATDFPKNPEGKNMYFDEVDHDRHTGDRNET